MYDKPDLTNNLTTKTLTWHVISFDNYVIFKLQLTKTRGIPTEKRKFSNRQSSLLLKIVLI